ncbi:amidohydrolase family protein [bacterium]|nr:amidohydrolase family protein [bacterium]
MKIHDFRVRFRTEQILKPWNPENPAPHYELYIEIYKMKPRLSIMGMKEFVKNMKVQGVSKGIVCGGSIEDNDHFIDIKRTPESADFYFFTGVHPKYGIKRNIEELEKCKQEGFFGANFSPYIWDIKANAKQLFPLYSHLEQNKQIAIIHGSLHYNRYTSMWLSDPRYFDEIAINFPKLKIVVGHAFSGYHGLGLPVAQRHPNIFLEFSALWPKYLPDVTMKAVKSYLKNRCLFGTSYPVVDFKPAIDAWMEALEPEIAELFFEKNAERCLFDDPV